jgi:hypothetical protein
VAHEILDQLEFTNLTGVEVSSDLEDRYHYTVELAIKHLEQLLGWPLVPEDWDNQYLEIGKSRVESSCPDADDENLDAPDAVIGSYRYFTLVRGDVFLAIDPATEIHKVKFVKNGVTCKDYEPKDYQLKYMNGNPQIIKFIGITKYMCSCVNIKEDRQFAIDADWAFEDIPVELKKVLADMIADELDPKKDIKSESVVSHSYTKFDREPAVARNMDTIKRYAGPNGTATRRLT